MPFDQALYSAQAKRISALMQERDDLLGYVERLSKVVRHYQQLRETILSDELLRDEWLRFLMVLKLIKPTFDTNLPTEGEP